MLKPFWAFYGGKWRAAPRYPAPLHKRIIEPFAGAAGYATRHHTHDVVLVEKDPRIAALWRYLIKAKAEEIETLPLIGDGQSVDDLDVEPSARDLIGFWLNKGATYPCKTPSAWMRSGIRPKSYWGKEIRTRIAESVGAISHWTVVEGEYTEAPTCDATWFIDPPYQKAGKLYRMGSDLLDFSKLGSWCQNRQGQVIVCENEGADWLPFQPFATIKSTPGTRGKSQSKEVIWTATT